MNKWHLEKVVFINQIYYVLESESFMLKLSVFYFEHVCKQRSKSLSDNHTPDAIDFIVNQMRMSYFSPQLPFL